MKINSLKSFQRFSVITILCSLPVIAAAKLISMNFQSSSWQSTIITCAAWLLCFFALQIYGWLNYILLEDPEELIASAKRWLTIKTKVSVRGASRADFVVSKQKADGVCSVLHIPSNIEILFSLDVEAKRRDKNED